uniref:Peptidase S1 domain-containing protein n=1 Tax=Amphilophus citrinellus TaxID=61819 RepID=A0A3Q0T458_AMPCI
ICLLQGQLCKANVSSTLCQLKKSVRKTKTVNWLKLGKAVRDPAAGSECLVAGWGETENSKTSDVLMSVNPLLRPPDATAKERKTRETGLPAATHSHTKTNVHPPQQKAEGGPRQSSPS